MEEELSEQNLADICSYLNKLDKEQIKRLGGELGLSVFNLDKKNDFPKDMVKAWLLKEDWVTKRCGNTLTWSVLVSALRKIGQNGIADQIEKDLSENKVKAAAVSPKPSPQLGPQGNPINDLGSGGPFRFTNIDACLITPADLRMKIELILHTCNENENNAALKFLSPPECLIDGEQKKVAEKMVFDSIGCARIGMFGKKLVAVPFTNQGDRARLDLEKALETYVNVTAVIGLGIGYGNPNKAGLSLGDVMVSDKVVQGSKADTGDAITFPEKIPVCAPLLAIAKNVKNGWSDTFQIATIGPSQIRNSKVHIGTIVSHDTLVKDAVLRDKMMATDRKAIGGEMEGWVLHGILERWLRQKRIISIIIIKGVADIGDKFKNDDWQPTAAMAAVDFLRFVLESCTPDTTFN